MFECFVFLYKSPQVESTESKGSSDTADAKAIAKIDADIEQCKSEIKDMKSQISQLNTDIAMKESELNSAQTNEEKVEIRKEKSQLNDRLNLLMTSKVQLETRLTNEKTHLNKLQEAALRPKEGKKD